MNKIFLSPPHMGKLEKQYLLEAFDSNWIAPVGPMIDEFEKEFAQKLGIKKAAAITSGTAAIHLALKILGVKSGDEVLTADFTFCASVNPIIYQGAKPIFIDSDLSSWNINPELVINTIEKKVSQGKTPAAVVLVDIYGQSVDYDPIIEVCKKYEIPMIDDATESLGAFYKGKPVGTFADISTFSFNGNKIITSGGGGMLTSDNEDYVNRAKFLSTQAKDPFPFYHHTEIGYNYRMSNLLAAVGRGQLAIIDDRVNRRREINKFYRENLADIPGISFMPESQFADKNNKSKHTFWLTTITIDPENFGKSANELRLELETKNIEARLLWKPMHMQPVYQQYENVGGEISKQLFDTGLCIPSGSSLTSDELNYIVAAIKSAFTKN